jgi:SAM-dependent methyltransferase
VADGLPGDAYDLIHARMLLMHLPTREKFLEEMAGALRPGGWLLVEEMDVYPLQTLAEGLFAEVVNAMIGAFETAGVDATMGRQLPDLFVRAGLEAVEPVCQLPVFRGGSPFTGLFSTSLAQVRPLILANGVTEEQLAELDRQFADPTRCFAVYSVRGRAPAA